jgi:hypothetical protein
MKANELRIGNMLSIPRLERELIVSAIFKTHFVCEDKDGIRFEESIRIDYQPITITEELLLKFGFEKKMAWTFAKPLSGNLVLVYYLGEKGCSIGFKNYSDFRCEYIHQLQNLYFALTGEELTININEIEPQSI